MLHWYKVVQLALGTEEAVCMDYGDYGLEYGILGYGVTTTKGLQ
jgi:hypothetical protein